MCLHYYTILLYAYAKFTFLLFSFLSSSSSLQNNSIAVCSSFTLFGSFHFLYLVFSSFVLYFWVSVVVLTCDNTNDHARDNPPYTRSRQCLGSIVLLLFLTGKSLRWNDCNGLRVLPSFGSVKPVGGPILGKPTNMYSKFLIEWIYIRPPWCAFAVPPPHLTKKRSQ